jgi:hypothetical protein
MLGSFGISRTVETANTDRPESGRANPVSMLMVVVLPRRLDRETRIVLPCLQKNHSINGNHIVESLLRLTTSKRGF